MGGYIVLIILCAYKKQELFVEYYPVRINSSGEMADDTPREMWDREEGIFLNMLTTIPGMVTFREW
jgi:hypothetical protein